MCDALLATLTLKNDPVPAPTPHEPDLEETHCSLLYTSRDGLVSWKPHTRVSFNAYVLGRIRNWEDTFGASTEWLGFAMSRTNNRVVIAALDAQLLMLNLVARHEGYGRVTAAYAPHTFSRKVLSWDGMKLVDTPGMPTVPPFKVPRCVEH